MAVASNAAPWGLTAIFHYNDVYFFGSALLLVSMERVPLPRWLHRPVTMIASSTLFIYLANVSVIKRLHFEALPARPYGDPVGRFAARRHCAHLRLERVDGVGLPRMGGLARRRDFGRDGAYGALRGERRLGERRQLVALSAWWPTPEAR